jgi:transcriptional/translational regulatory protein YebC/TACO1
MFDRVGEIVFSKEAGSADDVMEAAIEAGAEDITSDEEGHTIICAFEDIGQVSSALEAVLGEPESVNVIWRPQNQTPVDEDKASTLLKLLDALDEDDDVQNVYSNEDIDEAVMEKLSA